MSKETEALKLAMGELQAGKVGNAMQILREALAQSLRDEEQPRGEATLAPVPEAHKQQEPVSIKSVAQKASINLPKNYIPTMDEAYKRQSEQPCKHERVGEDYLTASFSFCKHCHKEWTKEMEEQPAQVDPCIDGSCSCCWAHLDEQPAQPSKPFDTHAAPGQSFDTHSRIPQQSQSRSDVKPWVDATTWRG